MAPMAATKTAPLATPDYFAIPNWANSPLPSLNGGVVSGGIRKFVNTLPGLCVVSGPSNLGQCLPLAQADKATFPGTDYYHIGLKDYSVQMHSDLPKTKLRGYVDLNSTDPQQYLGPVILATPTGRCACCSRIICQRNWLIPTDTTYMGMTVNGTPASQKRATLHLHGGNTPWISDGTTHQWITPAGGDGQSALGLAKGFSFQNVPDMIGTGKPVPMPSLTDGKASFTGPTSKAAGCCSITITPMA